MGIIFTFSYLWEYNLPPFFWISLEDNTVEKYKEASKRHLKLCLLGILTFV
jgi:hypothetical protein